MIHRNSPTAASKEIAARSFFLWGDSVAASLYPGLLNAQKTFDFGLGEFATAGCPPVIGFITHVQTVLQEQQRFRFIAHRPQ